MYCTEHVLGAELIQSKSDIQPITAQRQAFGGPSFTVKETESSAGQKWESLAQPWAPCIRARWLFLCEQRVLWQAREEALGTGRRVILLLLLQPGSGKSHSEENIQTYTCQQNDVSNAQAADSPGQEFKYQLSSKTPSRVVRAFARICRPLKQVNNKDPGHMAWRR